MASAAMRKVCEYFIASSVGRVFKNADGSALDVNVEMRRGEARVTNATVDAEAVMAYVRARDARG